MTNVLFLLKAADWKTDTNEDGDNPADSEHVEISIEGAGGDSDFEFDDMATGSGNSQTTGSGPKGKPEVACHFIFIDFSAETDLS